MRTGRHEARVVRHEFNSSAKGTDFLDITFDVGGEYIGGAIWLTDKAMPIARASLKVMGFDVDNQDLFLLDTNPTLLAGNTVPIEVEENEYNGRVTLKAKVILGGLNKSKLAEIQKKLRAAKIEEAPAVASETVADDDIPF